MNNATTMSGLKGLVGRMAEKVTGKSGGEHTAMIMQKVRKLTDAKPGKAPLIGHLPIEKQYLYAGGALAASLLLAAGFTIYSLVQMDNRAGYEARSGELKVLSQRLPLTAQQSVLGNAAAFKKLAEGKSAFESTLTSRSELDGWLLYDFHNRDTIACRVLGLDPHKFTSRRWFYWIPARGEPVGLVSRVESKKLDSLPGAKRLYLSWRELHAGLREILAPARRVAMQEVTGQLRWLLPAGSRLDRRG